MSASSAGAPEGLKARVRPDGRSLLNLGCGNRYHPGWTNVDMFPAGPGVLQCDLLESLPFEDQSFDVAYTCHFLEHLNARGARNLLGEAHRVLKNGGVLRVVVPDFAYNARLYLDCLAAVLASGTLRSQERYRWASLNLVDQMVRDEPGGEMGPFLGRGEFLDWDFVVNTTGGGEAQAIREVAAQAATNRDTPVCEEKTRRGSLAKWFRHTLVRVLGERPDYRALAAGQFSLSGELHRQAFDRFSLHHLLAGSGFAEITFLEAHESRIGDWATFNLDVASDGSIWKPHSLFVEAQKCA